MQRSYLVQRLLAPQEGVLGGRDNPFSFGGGLKNGGLSDEAMDLVRSIWSFDYMGSAEFEFGAVPEALNTIAQNQKHYIGDDTFQIGDRTVYMIIRPEWREEVIEYITSWSKGEGRLKEPTRLDLALNPPDWYTTKAGGWLELDNGYFFFVDSLMFQATCDLFEISVVEDAN